MYDTQSVPLIPIASQPLHREVATARGVTPPRQVPKATSTGHSPNERAIGWESSPASIINQQSGLNNHSLSLSNKMGGVKSHDFPILLKTLLVIFLFLLQMEPRGEKHDHLSVPVAKSQLI